MVVLVARLSRASEVLNEVSPRLDPKRQKTFTSRGEGGTLVGPLARDMSHTLSGGRVTESLSTVAAQACRLTPLRLEGSCCSVMGMTADAMG